MASSLNATIFETLENFCLS